MVPIHFMIERDTSWLKDQRCQTPLQLMTAPDQWRLAMSAHSCLAYQFDHCTICWAGRQFTQTSNKQPSAHDAALMPVISALHCYSAKLRRTCMAECEQRLRLCHYFTCQARLPLTTIAVQMLYWVSAKTCQPYIVFANTAMQVNTPRYLILV